MTSLRHLPSLVLSLAALAALGAVSAPALFAQGALTPPGAPAPSMKSLGEIDTSLTALAAKTESRIPVDTLPGDATAVRIISAPGSYYLRGNITSPGNSVAGIRIEADGVVLDLNGFTLTGTGAASVANGIESSLLRKRLIVRNGTLTGWYTGVQLGTTALAENLLIENSRWYGLSLSGPSVARSVVISGAGVTGIMAGNVEFCRVYNIVGSGVTTGIHATLVQNCEVLGLKGTGIGLTTGISGSTVIGCRVSNVESVVGAYGINAGSTTGRVSNCVVDTIESAAADAKGCGIIAANIDGCTVHQVYGVGERSYGLQGKVIANCHVSQISSSNFGAYVFGIAGDDVQHCRVEALTGSPLYSYGISGTLVLDNHVSDIEPTLGTSYGIRLDAGGQARGNTVSSVITAGIYPSMHSIVANNLVRDIGDGTGVGILVTVSHCRIQNNSIVASSGCDFGIRVTAAQNFILGNRCSGTFSGGSTGAGSVDTAEFNFVVGNRFGPIVSTFSVLGEITATNPYANFSD